MKNLIICTLALLWVNTTLTAQPELIADGVPHTIVYDAYNQVQEFKVPSDISQGRIYLEITGGDGGIRKKQSDNEVKAKGGQGAKMGAWFEIGPNNVPPGATILFILGEHGERVTTSGDGGGGGGGGSGLFVHRLNGQWALLIAAGGGEGGAADCCSNFDGQPGEIFGCVNNYSSGYGEDVYCYVEGDYDTVFPCDAGGSATFDVVGQQYYNSVTYSNVDCSSCNAGKRGWPGATNYLTNFVKPTGGQGGSCPGQGWISGGFGFGGGQGGSTHDYLPASGGGFTADAGSGGGSYINPYLKMSNYPDTRVRRGSTSNPQHGQAIYQIISAPKAICNNLTLEVQGPGNLVVPVFDLANNSSTSILGEPLFITTPEGLENGTVLLFNCDKIGQNQFDISVYGGNSGYTSTCVANVTVNEIPTPLVACNNISVSTDPNGQLSLSPDQLLANYASGCDANPEPTEMWLDENNFTFSCEQGGFQTGTVVLTVQNSQGHTASCTSTLSVEVFNPPIARCQPAVVQVNPGETVSLTASAIDDNSDPNCDAEQLNYQFGLSNLQLDITSDGFNDDISWTITSLDGNTVYAQRLSYGNHTIYFLDDIQLHPGCYRFNWMDSYGDGFVTCGVTINYYHLTDANGNTLAYGQCRDIGSGQSTEFCVESDTYLDALTFDCSSVGEYMVELVVSNETGISAACQTTIQVEGVQPIAVCQPLTVEIDNEGQANINATQLDGGSFNNCGGQLNYQFGLGNLQLEVLSDGFNQDISWTITSLDGNTVYAQRPSYGAHTNYFLEDVQLHPGCYRFNWIDSYGDGFVTCGATVNYYHLTDASGNTLAYGECRDIGSGQSTAFCVESDTYLDALSFDCSGSEEYVVELVVSNVMGISAACQTTIRVEDNVAPTARCLDMTVQLDAEGNASVTPNQIDNGSTDACGIASTSISQNILSCAELGERTLTLTVTDNHANQSSCTAVVTVEDVMSPQIQCLGDMTVYLDMGACEAMIDLINPIASDNCTVNLLKCRYRSVDEFGNNISGQDWSAWIAENSATLVLEPGRWKVQWQAEDASNNQEECSFFVEVIDNEPPVPVCLDPVLTFNGENNPTLDYSVLWDESNSTDNCGPVYFVDQSGLSLTCDQIGSLVPVTVTVSDSYGNEASCIANVQISGLPCGWMIDPNGIDCPGALADYDPNSGTFNLVSVGCYDPAYYLPTDSHGFIQRQLCGDGSITAQVVAVDGTGWAGISMRESNDPAAPMIQLMIDGSYLTRRELRQTAGSMAFAHHFQTMGRNWLRLSRIGNQFSAEHSSDGDHWETVFIANIAMTNCIEIGLITKNGSPSGPATGVFENVSLSGSNGQGLVAAIPTGAQAETQIKPTPEVDIFPNPFSDQATISILMPSEGQVDLDIFNLQGQRVLQLYQGQLDQGEHQWQWNGASLPSGMYLVQMRLGEEVVTQKVLLQD